MSNKLTKLVLLQPSAIDKFSQIAKTRNDYLERFLLPIYVNKNLTATEKWYKISQEFQKYITLQRKDIRPVGTVKNNETVFLKDHQKKEKFDEKYCIEKEEILNTEENKNKIDKVNTDELSAEKDNTNFQDNISRISHTEKIEDYVIPDLKFSPMPSKIATASSSARKLKNRRPNYDNMKIIRKGDSIFTVFDDNSYDMENFGEEKSKKGNNNRISPVITRSKTNDDSFKKPVKDVRSGSSSSSTRRHHAALRWDALED